ncbi:unnamed protein product [Porites lobata]|uniref:G-protein coupled receptors family 1 profile domain-containing protein n=1 Tax=Porites lobata TaxID=104759 RepID=A0ABN8QSF6_9CNID|nr:unnamed protein product [Porites lobata]
MNALTPQRGISLSVYLAGQFPVTLAFLNSSLNPLLYCWKIREGKLIVLRERFCPHNSVFKEKKITFVLLNHVFVVLSRGPFQINFKVRVRARGKRVSLAPKTPFPFPSKRLPRKLLNLLLLLSFITRKHTSLQISLKRSELKTTHNTFRKSLQNSVRPAMNVLTQTLIKSNKKLSCLFATALQTQTATHCITFRVYIFSGITAQIALVGPGSFVPYQAPVWHWFSRTALCLVTTIFAYTKISYTLRHNQIHVQNHVPQGQPSQAIPALNIARYRKAVYSALWVQGTLIICYLPSGIVEALQRQKAMTLSIYLAQQFTATLVYLNSSLNPLLYCWRIREVRQAVKETLRQMFRCSS